ncbi:MAG: hypothetical protein PHH49_02545 [Candidatus Omnitrophica bacterium]|nr:hypothetical protein [Candidatus Omnitrophota bacterium]MDD5487827.1 hypothetical protein [Candidatus Omnitrophota bacterium]
MAPGHGRVLVFEAGGVAGLIIVSAMLPVMFHILPYTGSVPVGARFLPIFYAPLLGILLLRPRDGIIAGALSPVLNHLVTGRPDVPMTVTLSLDMLLFTSLVSLSVIKQKASPLLTPLLYILAKFISSYIFLPQDNFTGISGNLDIFITSLRLSLPGIFMLFVLHSVVLIQRKKGLIP